MYYKTLADYTAGMEVLGQRVSYTYDALGRQHTVTDARGTTTYDYDTDGRLTLVDSPEGLIHYGYDPATGRHTRTWTPYTDTRYTYDELGRLKTVAAHEVVNQVQATPLTTTYAYDAAGRRDLVVLPNGVTTDYDFDAVNRLEYVETRRSDGTVLSSYDYLVRADGQREAVTESVRQGDGTYRDVAIDWEYDALDRLVSEDYDVVGTTERLVALGVRLDARTRSAVLQMAGE